MVVFMKRRAVFTTESHVSLSSALEEYSDEMPMSPFMCRPFYFSSVAMRSPT
jgi:hypothetical protein